MSTPKNVTQRYMKRAVEESATEIPTVPAGRFIDLAVLVFAYQTYIRHLEATGGRSGPNTSKGIAMIKRYGDEIINGFNQVIAPLTDRPDAGSIRTVINKATRATSPTPIAISYWADAIQAALPWMKTRSTIFNGLFTGKVARAARELAAVADEESPAAVLNRLAAIAPVSGVTAARKWIEVMAAEAGAPLSTTESVLTDAETGQNLGQDLQLVNTRIDASTPNTPDAADLQTQRTALVGKIEGVAKKSKAPSAVLAAAATASTNQRRSTLAERFRLTPEQQEVSETMGKVVVAAGAGSGKTTTLVATIANLVENKGYAPDQIMTCSFTRAASAELGLKLERDGKVSGVISGTTHRIARDIIIRHRPTWVNAMRNQRGADRCFKMAIKQVEMSIEGFNQQMEAQKKVIQRIEAIPGWRGKEILRSFHDQASKGRSLSPKQVDVIQKFEGGGAWRRWADQDMAPTPPLSKPTQDDWLRLSASPPPTSERARTNSLEFVGSFSDEEDVGNEEVRKPTTNEGRKSKFDTAPVGMWFNLGVKIKNDKGEKLGERAALLAVDNFKNSGITVDQAKAEFGVTPIVALYGAYEWLKLNDPVNGPAMDYTDQLAVALDILKTDPQALAAEQSRYKIIMIDEAQDLNQCIHEDTLAHTKNGDLAVRDLQNGDEILSYENGTATFKRVLRNSISAWNYGYKVILKSGRTLVMSPNHRIYAAMTPTIQNGQLALYLMYREGFGFRIGVSKNPLSNGRTGSSNRGRSEHADCLWVLQVGSDSEILYQEQALSLQYGIPTYPYEGMIRGLDQSRIDRLFQSYGDNGKKLLDERFLYFNYPHWTNGAHTRNSTARRVITLHAHRHQVTTGSAGQQSSSINMSWTGDAIQGLGDIAPTFKVKDDRWFLTRSFRVYTEAAKAMQELAHRTGFRTVEDIRILDQRCVLTTASALLPGMMIPTWDSGFDKRINWKGGTDPFTIKHYHDLASSLCIDISDLKQKKSAIHQRIREHQIMSGCTPVLPFLGDDSNFGLDEILSVTAVPNGIYRDLMIEDTGNFFGNGILSHNTQFEMFNLMGAKADLLAFIGDDKQSIYHFRGAKPENYIDLSRQPGYQTKLMTTNFRSGSEIVQAANRLIAHNEDRQIPMVCKAHEDRGTGAISALAPATHEDAANATAQQIKDGVDAGESASDFGILVRNNAEADAYTLALIVRGVPYRCLKAGQGGYFAKPVVRALTAWTRLAIGGSTADINDAVVTAHQTPGFFLDKMFAANLGRMAKGGNYYDYIAAGGEVYTGDQAWRNRNVAAYVDAIRQIMVLGRGDSAALVNAILSLKGSKDTFVEALMKLVDEDDVVEEEGDEGGEEAIRQAALAPVRPLMLMAENFSDPENMLAFIAKMKAANEKVEKKSPDTKDDWKEPAVLVGTVHGWKGLEAKHVFVSMAGGVFPNFRSDKLAEEQEATGKTVTAYDEERRLAYVAITRGRDTTTIMTPMKTYLGKPAGGSVFIGEACIPMQGDSKSEPSVTDYSGDDESIHPDRVASAKTPDTFVDGLVTCMESDGPSAGIISDMAL